METCTIPVPPRCTKEFKSRTVGALKRDTVRIHCEVDADPSKDVKFSWTFNTSGDVLPLPAARVVSSELSSHIDFTPISDADFGTLSCWAVNSIGRQEEPCMTHIVPAGVPEPPKECQLKNHTSGGLQVTCVPGYDGGLQQHFMLEVEEYNGQQSDNSIDGKTDFQVIPKFKVLGSEPDFMLRGLESGVLYTLSVFGINAKGRSEPPVVIPAVRFGDSAARLTSTESMKGKTEDEGNNPTIFVLGALIGVALLILVAIATTASLFLCKKKPEKSDAEEKDIFMCPEKKTEKNQFQVHFSGGTHKSKKVNNCNRKSVHEILPLEEINSLKPFADTFDSETVQTAVIRKNRGSAARQIRNSLSLSTGNPVEVTECRPIPVEIKPLNLVSPRNSAVVAVDESETEPLNESINREEIPKKSHARVTLNPEGVVLKCVIEAPPRWCTLLGRKSCRATEFSSPRWGLRLSSREGKQRLDDERPESG
ncbi:hypothetical protein RUM43_007106 [Polyplax serrata]|uniref:Ig-like domain-containing protein n=1 Tax=Polyplax serrata TaxID=468196 RepID=A0AAN8S7N3_POLSC